MVVDNIGVAQLKVIEGPRSVSPSPERPCVPCPAVQLDKGAWRNKERFDALEGRRLAVASWFVHCQVKVGVLGRRAERAEALAYHLVLCDAIDGERPWAFESHQVQAWRAIGQAIQLRIELLVVQ